jgi:hypothetical protein
MLNEHLMIALVAAALNFLLSMVLPSLLKDSKLPFAQEIKKNYECNKEVMLVSSLLTVVFVYVSLQITPWVSSSVYSRLSKLNTIPQLPVSNFSN